MILYLDILTTILQVLILISWGDRCFKRRRSNNLKNKIFEVALMVIVFEGVYLKVNNGALNNIITCIVGFFFIQIIYISNKKNTWTFIFTYLLLLTLPTITIVMMQQMVKVLSNINFSAIFGRRISTILLYSFANIWVIIYLKYKNEFIKFYKIISTIRYGEYIMFFAVALENVFYLWIGENSLEIKWNKIYYDIIFVIFLITIIFIVTHMAKIKHQESIIDRLNDTLYTKNNELRKIKHDYGAQISYLYGLYLLKRYDSLKNEIKKIKKKNEDTVSGVEINYSKVQKISEGLNNLLDKGIHLIIHEYGEIDNISISKKDLLNILEHISKCIIENTTEHSLILMKTYNEFGKLKIEMKSSKNKTDMQIIEEGLEIERYKEKLKLNQILEKKFRQVEEKFNKKIKITYKYGYITESLKVNIIIK